jgi:hypothetical protein
MIKHWLSIVLTVQSILLFGQNVHGIDQLKESQLYCLGNVHHFTDFNNSNEHEKALVVSNAELEFRILEYLVKERDANLLLIEWPVAFQFIIDSIIDGNNQRAFRYYNLVCDTLAHYESYLLMKNLQDLKEVKHDISIKCIDITSDYDLILLSNSILAYLLEPYIKMNLNEFTMHYRLENGYEEEFWTDFENLNLEIKSLNKHEVDDKFISVMLDLLDLNRGNLFHRKSTKKAIDRVEHYFQENTEVSMPKMVQILINSIESTFSKEAKREKYMFNTAKYYIDQNKSSSILSMGLWHLARHDDQNMRFYLENNNYRFECMYIFSQYHSCVYNYDTFSSINFSEKINFSKEGEMIFVLDSDKKCDCGN